MITVTREGKFWVARFPWSVETKDQIKAAGFRFDPARKVWYTADPIIAGKFDPRAAAAANRAIEASHAADAKVEIPAPSGLEYLGYQKAGIAYALSRPSTLLADEMGLGKTIQAIGVINADPTIKSVLVVCLASLKINWERELKKWLTRPMTVEIANGTLPTADVVIINYDILVKFRNAIDARSWDLLVADECHFAKNPKAQRTIALLGKRDRKNPDNNKAGIRARRRMFMTGTPIVNRPVELWPLVEALDPEGLGASFWRFTQRYTEAYNNGFGWDFKGAANLPELQQRLRAKFMVRRLKSEVLTELPPKRRQVVIVPPPIGAKAAIEDERKAFDNHKLAVADANRRADEAKARGDRDGYRDALKALHQANRVAFEEMANVRHQTAVAKIPAVIEHLTEVLEAEEKVVVFCHHLDVAAALHEAFADAALVTGETPMAERTTAVDRFQTDPNCKVFIGTYPGAAGVGWTLTAATTVVFAELDFVPGNVSQAEDRLHRIGQLGQVLVQHLVFDNSVDSYMAALIVEKQDVISAALDERGTPITAPAPADPLPLFTPPPSAAKD